MAKKGGRIIQFAKFREPHRADEDVRTSEKERGANARSETLIRTPRKGRQPHHHWIFKGWTAPSPFLTEMMRSPITAPPVLRGMAILESGALAYRRLKNGKLVILLVSKKRSKKWGIPKGRVNASLSFGETAAKEAYEASEAKMTSFPITPLRSAIRLVPAWAKQSVNATPSSWRVSALPLLHFRHQQTSPRNAISVPVRALPESP